MIIKTDKFELEISHGTGVYFSSKTSGELFRKTGYSKKPTVGIRINITD